MSFYFNLFLFDLFVWFLFSLFDFLAATLDTPHGQPCWPPPSRTHHQAAAQFISCTPWPPASPFLLFLRALPLQLGSITPANTIHHQFITMAGITKDTHQPQRGRASITAATRGYSAIITTAAPVPPSRPYLLCHHHPSLHCCDPSSRTNLFGFSTILSPQPS